MFAVYTRLIQAYPIPVKMASAATLSSCGDALCQHAFERVESHSWTRTRNMALLGSVIAPNLHFWYNWLARTYPGNTAKNMVRRVALDQLVFSPVFLPLVFGVMAVLRGETATLSEQVKQRYWPTLTTGWAFWAPTQAINFRFVPLQYNVLFVNVAGVLWNSYMSYVLQSDSTRIDKSAHD